MWNLAFIFHCPHHIFDTIPEKYPDVNPIHFLMPAGCPVCGAVISGHETLCSRCLMQMPALPLIQPIDTVSTIPISNTLCEPGIFSTWFEYETDSPYAAIIRAAKYHNRTALARALGFCFGKELEQRGDFRDIDVLQPVPMHWFKQLRRGYNQAHLIALGLGDALGIPVADNLRCVRSSAPQARSNGSLRLSNVKGRFIAVHPEELAGLHVAVVDDVLTTGATISEALHTLAVSSTPPSRLSALTLARAGNI